MRSSDEFVGLVRAAGAECRLLAGGTSYRAGGDAIVSFAGWWETKSPVRVERTEEKLYDPTGYDGRGRQWRVWRLVPDPEGMVPVSEGQWSCLPEGDRAVIGGDGSSKSQDGALYFGRPAADSQTDVMSVLSGILGAIKVAPVVVTRHPALVSLLRERGIVGEDARVIDHATPDDVRGQYVIGVLPLSLAALAARVTEIPLALTPEMRGKELDLATLRQVAGEAVTYRVTVVLG